MSEGPSMEESLWNIDDDKKNCKGRQIVAEGKGLLEGVRIVRKNSRRYSSWLPHDFLMIDADGEEKDVWIFPKVNIKTANGLSHPFMEDFVKTYATRIVNAYAQLLNGN